MRWLGTVHSASADIHHCLILNCHFVNPCTSHCWWKSTSDCCVPVCSQHSSPIVSLSVDDEGEHIASCAQDGKVSLKADNSPSSSSSHPTPCHSHLQLHLPTCIPPGHLAFLLPSTHILMLMLYPCSCTVDSCPSLLQYLATIFRLHLLRSTVPFIVSVTLDPPSTLRSSSVGCLVRRTTLSST